jgi:phosphatidylserine synthase
MAGTWRLARFIWSGSEVSQGRFEGLPITGAGLVIASFWLFEYTIWGGMIHPLTAYAVISVCAVLMVTRIRYEKFPEFGRHDKRNRLKWWIASTTIAIIAIKPAIVGFPVAVLYLGHGPALALFGALVAGVGGRQNSNGG